MNYLKFVQIIIRINFFCFIYFLGKKKWWHVTTLEKIKKCYKVEVTHESDHTPHSNCNINYAFSLKIENNKRLGFDNFFIWKHLLFLFLLLLISINNYICQELSTWIWFRQKWKLKVWVNNYFLCTVTYIWCHVQPECRTL